MGSFLIKQNFFFQKHKNKHWQSTVIATTDVGHLSIGCSNVCFTSLTSSDVEWELLCEPTMEPILTCAPLLFSFLLFLLLCFLLQLPTCRWGRVCLQTSWTFTSYQICGSYSTGWLVVSQWSSFSSSLKKTHVLTVLMEEAKSILITILAEFTHDLRNQRVLCENEQHQPHVRIQLQG